HPQVRAQGRRARDQVGRQRRRQRRDPRLAHALAVTALRAENCPARLRSSDELMSALDLGDYSILALALLVASAFVAGLARGFSGFCAAPVFLPPARTLNTPT